MNQAEIAIQNITTADRLIRGSLREGSDNSIVRYCLITEETLGPVEWEEGVCRYYYYTSNYITLADVHYKVMASIPDLSNADYDDDGNVCFLRMFLILHRVNGPFVWANYQLAQVVVDLEQNEEMIGDFGENRPVIRLGEARGYSWIIDDGLQTFAKLALGMVVVM